MAERWAGILAIGVLLACLIGQSAGQSDAAIQALFKWVEDNGGEVGTRRVEASCNSAHTHSHRATHAIMHGTPGGLGHHARALAPPPKKIHRQASCLTPSHPHIHMPLPFTPLQLSGDQARH